MVMVNIIKNYIIYKIQKGFTRFMVQEKFVQDISIEELLKRYSSMVFRLAFSKTRNKSDAEDITQEVFLKYMKYKKNFNDEEHRKAWLIKVTLNTSKTLLMSAWFRRTTAMEEADDIVTELNEKSEVYYAVLKLPAKYRQIVHLFYYEDMSVESISKITGIKLSTIKSQLHRARLMMKELLKEEADFV